MRFIYVSIIIFLFFLLGCGPGYQLNKAKKLEKKGLYVQSGVEYEKVYKEYPKYSGSPEALYRLGRIYQLKLKIYSHAHRYYKELLKVYPDSEPWATLAKQGLFNSPDFFPLTNGSFWIEGDSATGGRNMRSEWNCRKVTDDTFNIERRVSAGKRLVTKIVRFYRKKDWQLLESNNSKMTNYSVMLQFPFITGNSWITKRDNRTVKYDIVSERIPVKVKAGNFENCIKICESYPGFSKSKKYNYYAPEVGWVLTTVAGRGDKEHRNTELISYKIIPEKLDEKRGKKK